MQGSLYERDGATFVPTELTRGPWHREQQHGGPPAALLGRAIERFGDDAPERSVARLTFELFRPVPLAPLELTTALVRPGKTVDRVEATLGHQGDVCMRALGVRVRRRPLELDGATTARPDVAAPDAIEPYVLSFFPWEVGYHRAVELRFARGTWGDRDVVVWMRTLATLLPDEAPSPLERLLVLVDAESGVCPPLDPRRYSFVNPDLSVHLERPLEGEWLGLAVRSAAQPIGIGLAESSLFDARGTFGRAAQSLVIAPR